jgi:hypothetical protein
MQAQANYLEHRHSEGQLMRTHGEYYRGFTIEVDVVRLDEGFFIADRLRMAKIRDISTRPVSVEMHAGLYFDSFIEAVETSIARARAKIDWLMQECRATVGSDHLMC